MEPPDAQEKGIRFGCGFAFGLVIFGASSIAWSFTSGFYAASWVVVGAAMFGVLAMQFGDSFWDRLSQSTLWRSLWFWW